MEDKLLQLFLETIFAVITPILASLAAVYLKRLIDRTSQKLTTEQNEYIAAVVESFVKAAEQTGLKDEAMRVGAEKKAWVIKQAQAYLTGNGYKIDLAALSAIIESAVLDNFNWGRTQAKKPAQ